MWQPGGSSSSTAGSSLKDDRSGGDPLSREQTRAGSDDQGQPQNRRGREGRPAWLDVDDELER